MKKQLPCVLVLLALAALGAGCRRGLDEPEGWNLEKALGQRNRPDPPRRAAADETQTVVENTAPAQQTAAEPRRVSRPLLLDDDPEEAPEQAPGESPEQAPGEAPRVTKPLLLDDGDF